MALFKRAQVSVLLNEPDAAARIARARRGADATTRTSSRGRNSSRSEGPEVGATVRSRRSNAARAASHS